MPSIARTVLPRQCVCRLIVRMEETWLYVGQAKERHVKSEEGHKSWYSGSSSSSVPSHPVTGTTAPLHHAQGGASCMICRYLDVQGVVPDQKACRRLPFVFCFTNQSSLESTFPTNNQFARHIHLSSRTCCQMQRLVWRSEVDVVTSRKALPFQIQALSRPARLRVGGCCVLLTMFLGPRSCHPKCLVFSTAVPQGHAARRINSSSKKSF